MAESLAAALAELQASLPHIPKAARGQHGKYADLADLTRLILPRLAQLGLVWVTKPTLVTLPNGGEPRFVLSYELKHVGSGEDTHGYYPLGTGNPQQLGSAITYARRYCLCAVTGVAPDDDDDDGQAASEYRSLRRLDPEVRADGSATFAEQTRMMTGPEPGAYREAGTAGEVTEWNGTPTAPDEDNRLPALRAMFALYKELGVTDKDEMLADLTDLVGRGIDSRADLSLDDLAMTVNPALRARRDKQRAERSGKR